MGSTKLLQRFILTFLALSFISSLFAFDLPNLPYRDREADKKRFNVEDIVYVEEIILNQCNVTPSIQIANRIKNGALIYPFLPIEVDGNMTYTKEYRNKLDEKYQVQVSGKKVDTKYLFISAIRDFDYDYNNVKKADEEYLKTYKKYQERLAKLIEEQNKTPNPHLSLMENKTNLRDLFGTKVFDDNIYGILEQNLIIFYELFGWNHYISKWYIDKNNEIKEKLSRIIEYSDTAVRLDRFCNKLQFNTVLYLSEKIYKNKSKDLN